MFPNLVNQNFPERYYIFFNFFVMPVISENLGRITSKKSWDTGIVWLAFLIFWVSSLSRTDYLSFLCCIFLPFLSCCVWSISDAGRGEIYTKADKGYPYLVRAKQYNSIWTSWSLGKKWNPMNGCQCHPHSLSTYNLLHLDTVTW